MALGIFSLLQSDNLFAIAVPYKRRTYMLRDKIIPLPASHMCRDLVQLLTDIPLLLFLSYDGSVVKFFTYINLNLLRKAPCEHKKNRFVGSLAGWLIGYPTHTLPLCVYVCAYFVIIERPVIQLLRTYNQRTLSFQCISIFTAFFPSSPSFSCSLSVSLCHFLSTVLIKYVFNFD